MLVILSYIFAFFLKLFMKSFESFLCAKTVVGFSFFYQLFCIFHINACFYTLTLHIGTDSAILIRTLIVR